jgi:putative component of toxin-antitoxin plasmid stabilization module
MKKIAFVLFCFVSSFNAYSKCSDHYDDYMAWQKKLKDGQKTVAVVSGASSFFLGPVGVFFTTAVGASGLAAMDKEATKHYNKYIDCQKELKDKIAAQEIENQRLLAHYARLQAEEEEAKKKKEKEKLESVDI